MISAWSTSVKIELEGQFKGGNFDQKFYEGDTTRPRMHKHDRRHVKEGKTCTIIERRKIKFDGTCSKVFSCRVESEKTEYLSGLCLEKVDINF